MSDLLQLARPDLRSLVPYEPAAYEPALVRMNANEAPWRAPGDHSERGLNIYPPPRPAQLTTALAAHYQVDPEQILVTRGSSEAIDLLIRSFCRAGIDEVILCPPTFGMYSFYAQTQGAQLRQVPLRADAGFSLDVDGILDAWNDNSRLLFICSPNNPTGQKFDRQAITALCESLRGRGLVVIDEAYREFSATPDYSELRERFDHVVLLRTLSKAGKHQPAVYLSHPGNRAGYRVPDTRIVSRGQGAPDADQDRAGAARPGTGQAGRRGQGVAQRG
jgi:histidinol-phosphate aminotransferase